MSRSWLVFLVGLLALISPLRFLWAHPGASAWGVYAVAGAVALLGIWSSREPE